MCMAFKEEEDLIILYYDKERNTIIDECGFEIRNVFDIISPNMLYLFRKNKEDMGVYGVHGEIVHLFYPSEDEED